MSSKVEHTLPDVLSFMTPVDLKLSRDLKKAGRLLSDREARYLVDAYYQVQDFRTATGNQVRSLEDAGEPHELTLYFHGHYRRIENEIKKVLDIYTDQHVVSQWMKSIVGIGPVISAGMLAHIDITKAPTYGHVWSFAGLNPDSHWGKGEKRPWNASLKTLCWKLGESFVKQQNHDDDVYGTLYRQRKALEIARNSRGEFADQAAEKLRRFNIDPGKDAYKSYSQGYLPPDHIHSRAKRYAVKMFLIHLHHVWYEYHHGVPPPDGYVYVHQEGHTDYMPPPNWPMTDDV